MALFGLFKSKKQKEEALKKGLEKTKSSFFNEMSKAIVGKSTVDVEVLDELEELLIAADVGVDTMAKIINNIEKRVEKDKYLNSSELSQILKEEIQKLICVENTTSINDFELPEESKRPHIILVVGVNGVGKTTTIGKLSAQYKANGYKVLLGAADTFRAAAVDQLKLWAERNEIDIVSHGMNTDPSAVAHDTARKAKEEGYDVALIDTAGRLHTKVNLMNELTKIRRVIQKFIPEAPHDVILVLDGSTGQNAVIQATEFTKATEVTSLTITKLDGTSKGGVVIGISDQFNIPVKYIGVGEKVNDLQVFDPQVFVDAFFSQ